MFDVLPITSELLAALGDELGGCDFTDASQIEFLANTGSCDVQAAPGNGKATLLAAKLALLSRNWTSRQQGVCVISHTNAARTEVEDLIGSHPTAARLMAYPHFIGTVTAFINQYIALPYLRGFGWNIRQIDDDAFAAEALRVYPRWSVLGGLAENTKLNLKRRLEDWIARLDLDPDFTDDGPSPASLAVRRRKGQHGADTPCGIALGQLKAAMVKSGFYRYADMTALAKRALKTNPGLADRLRARFPLVILDEAQDTHGEQLKLLEHLFKHGNAFQRLGDSNQTLYEDDAAVPAYWTPDAGCIPVDTSRRFGSEIASFASRLTVRKAQVIVSAVERPTSRVLLLFDEATIRSVLGAFADEARAHWGDACETRDIWAVASRHNIPGKKKGAWQPKSLVDYHPAYRGESGVRDKANLLCRQLQRAAAHHAAARPPAEVGEMLAAGVAGLARAYNWRTPGDQPISAHNIWSTLAHRDLALPRQMRRLLRDHVLVSNAAWEESAWNAFLASLRQLFGTEPDGASDAIATYCGFVAQPKTDLAAPESRSTKQVQLGDVTLRLGSIHSVKGKSVDGILVVESEVWKGSGADEKCIDLTTVLPHAFGVTDQTFTGVDLTAATNVFVAVTRPRELLGLALRKGPATHPLIEAAKEQGWKVLDLIEAAKDAAL